MRQLSKHDVNKLTVSELKELLPFELMSDGEAIALVSDVNILEPTLEANHDVNRLRRRPTMGAYTKAWQLGKR